MTGQLECCDPFDIYSYPKIPRQQPELLPHSGGIYIALDGAQRVWYVGQATSLRERLSAHEKLPQFVEAGVQFVAWREAADKEARDELERRFIERFAPPLNQLLIPRDRPVLQLGLTPEEELSRYLELKQQMTAIEFELNMLKANIVTRCEEKGGSVIMSGFHVFLNRRQSWRYSENIERMAVALAAARKVEQDQGIAVVTSTTVFPVVKVTAKGG